MKLSFWLITSVMALFPYLGKAQGPPITADKPIMLGGKTIILKTLTEILTTNQGTFVNAPLMMHYVLSSNSLVALHIPFTYYDFKDSNSAGSGLGDINVLAKYQFYRKDKTGKTFRMVAKTLQTLPTGKALNIERISTREYQSYLGIVAGYETLKYGISSELGYNLVPNNNFDEIRFKLGFGLPLLKPTYPVNQVNLYFEYSNSFKTEINAFEILYAQGIQYAIKQLTWEIAVQLPLVQNNIPEFSKTRYSIFLGSRYIF